MGPAEPKHKTTPVGDYSSTTFKRVKPDQNNLRAINTYGGPTTAHPHYHPHQHHHHHPNHHQYRPSNNADMMQTFFQQYGATSTPSAKGPYSNGQHSYWTGTRDDPTGMWQQQHYH